MIVIGDALATHRIEQGRQHRSKVGKGDAPSKQLLPGRTRYLGSAVARGLQSICLSNEITNPAAQLSIVHAHLTCILPGLKNVRYRRQLQPNGILCICALREQLITCRESSLQVLRETVRKGDDAPVSNRHCELRWTKQRDRNATDSNYDGAIKRPTNGAHKGAVHMLGIKDRAELHQAPTYCPQNQ